MLEGVDVDAAIVQRHVRGDIVGEVDHLDGQTVFLFGYLGSHFNQFGLGAGNSTHFQNLALFFLTATGQNQTSKQGSRNGFDAKFHKTSCQKSTINDDHIC